MKELRPAADGVLCKAVWKSERLPDQWCSSLLIQLYKGNGSKSDLSNQRFIHIKDEFPKFFRAYSCLCCQGKDCCWDV